MTERLCLQSGTRALLHLNVFRTQTEREKEHCFSTPSGAVSKGVPGGKNPGTLTMAERHETMRTLEELLGKNNLKDPEDIDALVELAEITGQIIRDERYPDI